MINRHLRKAVVVTAAITAGLLMTACQNEPRPASGASSVSSSGTSEKGSASGKGSANEKGTADQKSSAGQQGSAGSAADADNAAVSAKPRSGVSGSFKNGVVTYLAPGKLIVSVPGKGDQAFWLADDTEVYGAGVICGDAQSTVDAPCTIDQLESAAKKGAVKADVTMKNGVATLVTERRTGGKGVSGTWFGAVSYVAPGKYTVSDMKGVEQMFLVSDDTKIWGAGDICGDAEGQSATQCTEAQLETAAKKGFDAEVKIQSGIATTITDNH